MYRERRSVRVRGYIWALFDVTFKVPCSRVLLIALGRTGSLLILRSLITTDSLKLRAIYDPARQAPVRYIFRLIFFAKKAHE